jgi:hypothetical protein
MSYSAQGSPELSMVPPELSVWNTTAAAAEGAGPAEVGV